MDDFRREINNRWARRERQMKKAGFKHVKEGPYSMAGWEDQQSGILRYMSDAEFGKWFASQKNRKKGE